MEEGKRIISKEEIEKMAELSRINLSDEEKEKVTSQLESVLNSVKVLEEIDMADFDSQGSLDKIGYEQLRSDEVKEVEESEKEAIRENFSSRKGDFLSIKSMF